MFFDELTNELNRWFKSNTRSIFVIEGPSQIGKTHFIKNYIQTGPANRYLYVDVKTFKGKLESILEDNNLNNLDFYTALCFEFGKTPTTYRDLLVFDGIEYCPKLRQFFKSLLQLEYLSIVAIGCGGIGVTHYKDLLVPSEEDVHYMFPLDFYDFMMATNRGTLGNYLNVALNSKKAISEYLSKELYKEFKKYNLIGGYPLVIDEYIRSKDLNRCINLNKQIIEKQFEHAENLLSKEDGILLSAIQTNFYKIISSNKYNSILELTAYKAKQLLTFLEEEYVINISTAYDVSNISSKTSGKQMYLSHQCFYYALSDRFDRSNYFNSELLEEIVLTDFYFNQRKRNKQLNYALIRGTRYFESDALIVNSINTYVVEFKSKRLSTAFNIKISAESNGLIKPGVLLFNSNVFSYDKVCVLPSYCSCFLNGMFL